MGDRDTHTLARVCEWYYIDGYTQQQIATRLRVSRYTVMRLLKEAKERGIVTITIASPGDECSSLSRELESVLGLWRAIVVRCDQDDHASARALGAGAAALLAEILREGDLIGVSSGTTIAAVVNSLSLDTCPRDLQVVQLVGSFPSEIGHGDAYRLASELAGKLNAGLAPLLAPAIVDKPELHGALIADSNIQPTFRLFSRLDVAIVGIGSLEEPGRSHFIRQGLIGPSERDELLSRGAVGDILSRFFDSEGRLIASSLDDRVVAMRPEALRRVPYSIGVAAGADKARAILAAVRGGYIKALVTDEDAARSMLRVD